MPARHQQHQIGKAHPVCQARCQRVSRQVVHAQQRQACGRRNPLGQHHARQDAADQPWPRCDRHRIQIAQRHPRLGQGAFHAVIQPFGMGAGGDFGHNTAKIGVQRRLAFHLRA